MNGGVALCVRLTDESGRPVGSRVRVVVLDKRGGLKASPRVAVSDDEGAVRFVVDTAVKGRLHLVVVGDEGILKRFAVEIDPSLGRKLQVGVPLRAACAGPPWGRGCRPAQEEGDHLRQDLRGRGVQGKGRQGSGRDPRTCGSHDRFGFRRLLHLLRGGAVLRRRRAFPYSEGGLSTRRRRYRHPDHTCRRHADSLPGGCRALAVQRIDGSHPLRDGRGTHIPSLRRSAREGGRPASTMLRAAASTSYLTLRNSMERRVEL